MDQKELQRFYAGNSIKAYELFGAQAGKCQDTDGVYFRLYAPKAKAVNLVGEFNDWDDQRHPLHKVTEDIWEVFVPGVTDFAMYKYRIQQADGQWHEKADPYAAYAELRPGFASKVILPDHYQWHDADFLAQRTSGFDRPVNIYECHLGGFRHKEDGSWYTYYELVEHLVKYVKEMGFTHLEVMPLNEYPLDASWGYQQYGYFALTSRYGSPYQFKMLVDACHQCGIGVIMDFVAVHFASDAYGLASFDGSPLYESSDPKHQLSPWGSYYFDLGKPTVSSFLLSSAAKWLDVYHIDGLRVDAVSNIIFQDGNKNIGFNYGGLDFIKHFNIELHKNFPGLMTVAEDSSDYPHVTQPVYNGGLGFDYKWDLGWMNDTLNYYKLDPVYRSYHHNDITFSMAYFWAEKFIMPLSHDEVVHSKATIVNKMWGSYEQKFAQCKNLMIYMYTHPGKKLSFMGNEIATFREFDEDKELDWFLLKYPIHDAYKHFVQTLNHLYQENDAFYRFDYDQQGFQWVDADNSQQQIFSYLRFGVKDCYLVVLNMSPVAFTDYHIGVPYGGTYHEVLNSDQDIYNGANCVNDQPLKAVKKPCHNRNYYLSISIAPFAGLIIKGTIRKPVKRRTTKHVQK